MKRAPRNGSRRHDGRWPRRARVTLLAGASAVACCVVGWTGCAQGGVSDQELFGPAEEDTLPSSPLPSGDASATPAIKDAGRDSPDGAARDASPDVGVDAGKVSPQTGDPCSTIGELFVRACGACGRQEAVCETTKKVGGYGFCGGEVAGGCIPGKTEELPCGLCGKQTRICQNNCTWAGGGCVEPAGACKPGTVKFLSAGCTAPDTYRAQTCANTCTWGALGATCAAPVNPVVLVASASPGGVVSTVQNLTDTVVAPRLNGTCPAATLTAATSEHPYFYVEVQNPLATPVTVTVYNTIAPGGAELDTVMWTYGRALPPQDDTEKKACQVGVRGDCPLTLCGGTITTRLASIPSLVIPANRKVLVYVSTQYVKTSAYSLGPVGLSVRTDAVGP